MKHLSYTKNLMWVQFGAHHPWMWRFHTDDMARAQLRRVFSTLDSDPEPEPHPDTDTELWWGTVRQVNKFQRTEARTRCQETAVAVMDRWKLKSAGQHIRDFYLGFFNPFKVDIPIFVVYTVTSRRLDKGFLTTSTTLTDQI